MPTDPADNVRFPDYVNAIERLGKSGGGGGGGGGGAGAGNSAAGATGSMDVPPLSLIPTTPPHPPGPPPPSTPIADVVLVDGRFRVAVALKALWHVGPASVVLIHDWPPRAAAYGRVLAYYDIVDAVDELVVLARKADLDWAAAAADLATYVNHPARRA